MEVFLNPIGQGAWTANVSKPWETKGEEDVETGVRGSSSTHSDVRKSIPPVFSCALSAAPDPARLFPTMYKALPHSESPILSIPPVQTFNVQHLATL